MLPSTLLPLILIGLVSRARTDNTQAFSLPPTGNWDGNDGGWSTFAIRVGTPPQVFRVLPSTSGTEIYIPLPDNCALNQALCGSARGVEPSNAAPVNSSPLSGTPSDINGTSVDAGATCTANRSPMCSDCTNSNGRCTDGPCSGRQCCGDVSACISTCMGIGGICTGQFIGCPCTGPDYNAGPGVLPTNSTNPSLAQGYQYNVSSSWGGASSKTGPIVGLPLTLGIHDVGLFGTETIGLGADVSMGLTLQKEPFVGVNASSFYIGSLGLGSGPGNSSLLDTLFQQKMIPSITYGYTAGALYQQPPVLGSLTLGGYDAARSASGPNLTSPLRANDSSIMVGVGAITLANALTPITTLLSIENNLTTLIDTTLPYTYLPLYVCQQMEAAFGLQWDAAHDVYLINDTTHQQLLKNAPTITFTLSTSLPEPEALNVTVPYAAFDLTAAYPIFPNGTNYFPLRRANNSAQFVLGRAFMQEAFIFVDYEASQVTISQAAFPASGVQNIVTVNRSANGTSGPAAVSGNNGLSVGAIAGVAIGASVVIVLLCTLGWLVWRPRKPRRRRRQDDVWRAPVSKGPSANSSGSAPEKPETLSWGGPAAFNAYRSEQTRSRAYSDKLRQSQSTEASTPSGKFKKWVSPLHSRKPSSNVSSNKAPWSLPISNPTSPLHNGKAMMDVDNDPWQTSALDPPTKPSKATPPTGHTRMFSILDDTPELDDKPLPKMSGGQRPGLPKLNTAQEMYRPPKEWETPKEWDHMDVGWSPSPISPEKPQQSRRPSYGKSRGDSFNTIVVDSEASTHRSKPSVGSEASKARQKHIWEMQSPGSSRGGSPYRHRSRVSLNSQQTSTPAIPEIPPSRPESQVPTPATSPGPEARRRHIWELQSPGGSRGNSRGNSRKHSRSGTRDLAREAGSHYASPDTASGVASEHESSVPGQAL